MKMLNEGTTRDFQRLLSWYDFEGESKQFNSSPRFYNKILILPYYLLSSRVRHWLPPEIAQHKLNRANMQGSCT